MSDPLAFSLLIKPNGDRCKLNCSYCFYKGTQNTSHPMSTRMIRAVTQAYRTTSAIESYTWQGGEPTDIGVDFFREAVSAQGENAVNSLQTNGLVFGEANHTGTAWWELLKGKGNWIVGLSHDGPTNESRGVRTEILDSAAMNLRTMEIPFSILCVVSEENVDNPRGVVEHFYSDRTHACFGDAPIQFIHAKGSTVSGLQFAVFLGESLECSPDHGARIVNYRVVDDAWHKRAVTCEILEECGTYLMIDGARIYPCDFFGQPEWMLMEVLSTECEHTWAGALRDAFTGEKMQAFRELKTAHHEKCEKCAVLEACWRGCPSDRENGGLSSMCAANEMVAHITHPSRAGRG